MTTVASIFHKLKPDDPEFMLKMLSLFQQRRRVELWSLPFVDAYRMYIVLGLRVSDMGKFEIRKAESIQKKLKRAMIEPYNVTKKKCLCPICSAWKLEAPSGVMGTVSGRSKSKNIPITQQLPTRLHRSVTSHIQGTRADLIIMDDVTQEATISAEEFAKALREMMTQLEKNNIP